MEKKRKRSTMGCVVDDLDRSAPSQLECSGMCIGHSGSACLIDPTEIKKEICIKEEDPDSVGHLIDVPVVYDNESHPLHNLNEHDGEDDFALLGVDDVKIEPKQEIDCKKEKETNTNADSRKDAAHVQQNRQLQPDNGSNSMGNSIPKNNRKAHKCDLCEYSTKYRSHLKRHSRTHTNEKPYGCKYCAKQFTSNGSLSAHMKVHVEEFLFHCSGCLQGFDEKDAKMIHETGCMARRYECHVCKQSFGSQKTNLLNHVRVHSGHKPFECTKCQKQFSDNGHLTRHKKIHFGPPSFHCSRCRLGFTQENIRNAHEGKCSRRVYECYVCGKFIGSPKAQLLSHMYNHTGEKRFKCKHCLKKYTQKPRLDDHLKSHTENLPFKCSICRLGFLKQTQRKVHQKTCFRKGYECFLCGKFFGWLKANLKGHMTKHTGEKYFKCKLCDRNYTLRSSLKTHINRSHNGKMN